jgi:hypothetical protein
MFIRYYGGGVGHVDPRRIEEAEVGLVEVGDEGLRPDHGYEDTEESDVDDDADNQSDLEENSDEETASVY